MIIPEIHLIFYLVFCLILFYVMFNFHIDTAPGESTGRAASAFGVHVHDAAAHEAGHALPHAGWPDELPGVVPR